MIREPVSMILCFALCSFIQLTDSPSISSASFSGCMLNPVENISGSTTISVGSTRWINLFSNILRLASLFSQCKSVCIVVIFNMLSFFSFNYQKPVIFQRQVSHFINKKIGLPFFIVVLVGKILEMKSFLQQFFPVAFYHVFVA